MDSVKAFLVWPLVTTTAYTKFLLGFSFASVPALIHIIQHGTSSLSSFVDLFNFLKTIPFGLSFYSGLVCFYAPYTGSIHSRVVDFSSLHKCVIEMPDLPLLRNPFGSVHAAALTNLGAKRKQEELSEHAFSSPFFVIVLCIFVYPTGTQVNMRRDW